MDTLPGSLFHTIRPCRCYFIIPVEDMDFVPGTDGGQRRAADKGRQEDDGHDRPGPPLVPLGRPEQPERKECDAGHPDGLLTLEVRIYRCKGIRHRPRRSQERDDLPRLRHCSLCLQAQVQDPVHTILRPAAATD